MSEQLLAALTDCVNVMERDLNGLAVIQPELRHARAAIASYCSPAQHWTGEGLPPAGTDVEIQRGDCAWIEKDEWQIGKTATVMTSFTNSLGYEIAAIQFAGGHCECILTACIRPFRTTEQIAADEREKAAIDLHQTIHPCAKWDKLDGGMKASYRAAITLGWQRKQADQ